MSVLDSLNFAEKVLQIALHTNSSKFVTHKNKLEIVMSWLCDEQSKVHFQNELSYLMLKTINRELADQVSPFTKEQWDTEIVARWDEFVKSPQCPKMACKEEELGYLATMLMTTYVAEQYRYGDLVKVNKGDVFIDCGACFGDTALWAYHNGASKVYSFEPSPYNYQVLVENFKANGHDTATAINLAVGDKECKIPFAAAPGMAGASYATADGNIEVDCIVLDDWIEKNKIKPDFLKYDIEGAELEALKGSVKTIQKYRPRMCVCLYHKIEHMWELPIFIKSINPDYEFYCRKNSYHNEFVLYCVDRSATTKAKK
ncbi:MULTISPECIES: FkbM family methyltransferase [unclassified Anaerobiospirillum]|uniref:FkbM family methyltransferase n=1 Tax=unclassified Anaerobiospirillum TaxID=2647410 RepID=UPI001FF2ECAE|nr:MULTISPECIES: FkbM family methyltransferase [unclassified Anaerobiospirillum]MCK0535511.1 FkbM family methyltransferase [Anaerobiospirillum sp. NML120511]MCK0540708.1 FkbM family methyltransferase [Anaerobiospirillum sp. NML02-A-032]